MTRRIFKYMELIILVTLVAGLAAILLMLYGYFGAVQQEQLKTETEITAEGVETGGEAYLESLKLAKTRVTWIDTDGTVLFDNQASTGGMENHLDRPEVKEALQYGTGSSSRFSNTMTTQMLYQARKLSDGTILRVSETRNSVLTIAMGMITPMIWLLGLLLIVTWFAASRASRKIVAPLNTLDLDNPVDSEEYPEISPLLRRIREQQDKIEEQKDSLTREEKDFAAVTSNMAEGLILLNESGTVLSINQQAAKLLKVDAETSTGKDILELERRVEFQNALKGALAGKRGTALLTYGTRKFDADITPVSDGDRTAGIVVLLYDITERENAEQMRREFSGNVSHELKTPLHTISGCAELLESGEVKPEDRKRFVHTIYTQTQRMISLVEDILYISHLDEGSVDMNRENIDLYEAVRKEMENLQHAADQKHVSLRLSGSSVIVPGIRRLTESIIWNLLDNAVKYNKDGGSVNVSVREEGDGAVLTVADTGIGVPEADLPRIFERFYRVDKSHSREIGGTGLGLSIVKHAAVLQNAKVDVKSKVGEGTTFTVAFPEKTEEAPSQA